MPERDQWPRGARGVLVGYPRLTAKLASWLNIGSPSSKNQVSMNKKRWL